MKKTHLLVFISIVSICLSNIQAADTSPQFIQANDTLVVYKDVPGLTPSDKYTIRVRSAATNNEWVDVFVNFTYNRAAELGGVSVPQTDGTTLNTTVMHYAKHTSAWSHAYSNIEMSKNTPVEVEIAAKNGFKIANKDFIKATVHPAQKASIATLVDGKIYFTLSNPCQLVIDINGQMDDYNAAINPIGAPVHAISFFANPVIKKPTLNGSRVRYIEVGTDSATMSQINPASYDTLYFKPGIHNIGKDFKIYPGKVYYIPGDAIVYGNINNLGVPQGIYSKNGENIRVFGYGTISLAKISHPNYVLNATGSYKGFEIENGLNWRFSGVTIADPSNHSVYTIGGSNGMFTWTKVFSWRANGDGIGGYEPVTDCFIRTQDDCSYAKGYKARCTFWKDANAAMFHLATITENEITPLIMEDCDVIYARHRSAVGFGGVFQQRGEGTPGQRKVNVIFRDFRIHDKLCNLPIFNLVSYTGGTAAAPTQVGSSYYGFLFQNISIAGMAPGNKQNILGCAAAPWYGGLIFDNISIGGTKITTQNYKTYFNTNEFVKYLLFAMPQDVTLSTIADPAKGTITRTPEQSTYKETSEVTINANGKSGYVFSHWSGDLTGSTNPIKVIVDKNMTITANFADPDFGKPLVVVAPGTGEFTMPAGIDSVSVQVWSAGGAGGSASNDAVAFQSRAGGGAGGAFVLTKKKVTAGQVLSYSLGAGGIAAPDGFTNYSVNAIQNGGVSSVKLNSEFIAFAMGGPGGQSIAGAAANGAGGYAPKSGSVGDIIFFGGNGGTANSNSTGSGGGSAGTTSKGGDAVTGSTAGGLAGTDGGAVGGNGINSTNVGNPGNVPGAGGSGAAVRAIANSTRKGGAGANGKIIFTFKLAPNSIYSLLDTKKAIDIYPNPATDKLFFNSADKLIDKIQLVDLTGKIVYSANVQLQNGSVDLKGISKGMYLVKMYIDTNIVTKKISIK